MGEGKPQGKQTVTIQREQTMDGKVQAGLGAAMEFLLCPPVCSGGISSVCI